MAIVEQQLGYLLPREYKEFIAIADGAEPELNTFRIDETNDSGVNQFIPVSDLLSVQRRLKGRWDSSMIPVAWAEGGNYVLIHRNGTVHFWDHELGNTSLLAGTFEQFLECLEPFDLTSVKLKPGQVTRVWVDPSFLAKHKK